MLTPVGLAAVVGFAGTYGFMAEPVRDVAPFMSSGSACHSSYVGRCLPIGRDIDCWEIGGAVQVVGDVYRLDGDHDGIGCEGA